MRIRRRATLCLTMAILGTMILASAIGCAPGNATEVTIFTGGTGGTYFPLGSRYAELLNEYGDGIGASAVTSGASVTNCRAIGTGECQAALVQNDVAYYARQGTNMFDTPISELRGVACWYPETIQFVVTADSDIVTLADMEGKNVAVGAPGSGTAVACEQILRAAGVWDTITRFDLNFAESASALRLGEVDVGFLVAGYPTAAIEELAVTEDVRLVEIPDTTLTTLLDEGYVFYTRQTVPAGTYDMSEGVDTVAVQAMMVVREDMHNDVVYDMTAILFERVEELRTVHTKANDITLETALEGMSITLHQGAVDYYEEVGLTCPPRLTGQS